VHDLHFADAVRPPEIRVLKLALLPYSLGHEALLLRQRNAFLLCSPEQFAALPLEQQIFAVKTAALICSQDWQTNHGRQKWLRVWSWATRRADYSLEIAEFWNYLTASRQLPSAPTKHACEVLYGKDDDKGRPLGSPLLAQLYNWVSDNPGKFQLSAFSFQLSPQFCPWDASFALAGTLYFAALEMEGRARIENAAEAEEQAAYDQILRDIAAEQAAATLDPRPSTGLATAPPAL
jgi:hypothetical protein